MMRAVLFDLDGVLIDSEGSYTECWSGIDRAYPTGVKDFAHVIKGNTLSRILNTYFKPSDHEAVVEMLNTFERDMVYRIFPGAIEFLQALKAQGVLTAIVTSSSDRKMESLYRQLPDFSALFDTIVTGSDVTASKPDPQGYLLAAKRLGCLPAECYVIEDSLQGLEAGMAAGARVIGLATTNSREAINDKAHLVAGSIADLIVSELF